MISPPDCMLGGVVVDATEVARCRAGPWRAGPAFQTWPVAGPDAATADARPPAATATRCSAGGGRCARSTGRLQRWSIDQFRPLAEYSPYAAHVLVVELFFQIALAANLISAERPSNRIDVAYLCYLPFSTVFISSDKVHRKCAPVFLRNNQEFVWGPDLKRDLGRVNNEFSKLAPAELEKGLMNFARAPLGEPTDLIVALWDRHTPNWRTPRDTPVPMAREEKKKLLEHLRLLTDASTEGDAIGLETDDMDQMAIERMVPKKKGSWWLLPRDLKVEDKRGR